MSQTLETEEKIFELHAALCQTLANPIRLRILRLLGDEEMAVNEIARQFGVPQANISQHLSVLRDRNVLTTRRESVSIYHRIAYPRIIKACNIIREVLFEQMAESRQLVQRFGKPER
jgi:DNA-binding transcriptional ArsR family regulator